jgi:hypothetical protein
LHFVSFAIALWCCAEPLAAQTPGFVSFDARGAGQESDQGTRAICINRYGTVAGEYTDSSYTDHGFVRFANGHITEFDAPGLQGTEVSGINSSGQIIGNAQTDFENRFNYAYLRNPDGHFVLLNAPGAVSTFAEGINDSGEITGFYIDSLSEYHGFVRGADGGYTEFDEPNADEQFREGTFPAGINNNGEVVGRYSDAEEQYHGFTRDSSGNFTSFDAPGAGNCIYCGTFPTAINSTGEVAGNYTNHKSEEFPNHAFIRDAAGNITDFDVTGATQTWVTSLGDAGEIVGGYSAPFNYYGYTRDPSGKFLLLSAPVPHSVTYPLSVNPFGTATGYYYDQRAKVHGFVRFTTSF